GGIAPVAPGDALVEGGDVAGRAVREQVRDLSAPVGQAAPDRDLAEVMAVQRALGAVDAAADVVPSVAELLRAERDEHVLGAGEAHREVTPAASRGARLSSSAPHGVEGGGVETPGRHVQGVDVLLGDDVTGEDAIQSPGPQPRLRIVGLALEPLRLLDPGRSAGVG